MEKPKKYEERLMTAFDFDEHDLEANRSGALSKRQMMHLRSARERATFSWAIPALLIVGGLGLWLSSIVTAVNAPAEAPLVPLIVGVAVLSLFVAYYGVRSRRLKADLVENRVSEVEGRVELLVVGGQNSVSYRVRVGEMQFLVRKPVFLAFKNGDPYRIYYAPHSKRILSVEWLRENDDNLLDEGESRADLTSDSTDEATSAHQQLRRPR